MATSPAILVTMLKLSEPRKERFGTRRSNSDDALHTLNTQKINVERSEALADRMANGRDFLRMGSLGPLMADTADMFSIPSNMMREIRKRTRDYGNLSGDRAIAHMRTNPEGSLYAIAGHKAYDPSPYVVEDGSPFGRRMRRSFFEPAVGTFDSRNYPPKGGLTSPKI